MKYREQILYYINESNQEAFGAWIKSFPELDQVEIMRDLKELGKEILPNLEEPSVVKTLEKFTEKIENYQESILDYKLLKAQHNMVKEDKEKVSKRITDNIEAMRPYIIESVLNQAHDATEMMALAAQMIAFEKKTNRYDAANWKSITGI
jgi:predicted RND superfamily exporter protein